MALWKLFYQVFKQIIPPVNYHNFIKIICLNSCNLILMFSKFSRTSYTIYKSHCTNLVSYRGAEIEHCKINHKQVSKISFLSVFQCMIRFD